MSQLVRIPTPDKGNLPLSKAQKEFNRLTKKIEELENGLAAFRTTATKLQQRIQVDYEPLLREYNQLRASLVRVFDQAYERSETTKSEKKKLKDLLLNLAYDLIIQYGMDELKSIFDKYDPNGYDATDAEADTDVSEVMKEMIGSMYGIKFDDNVDVSTKEKFMAYIDEQMQARKASQDEQHQQAETRKAQRPKSAKQQEREAKKLVEARNITKAVRTLYMDLVKTFHPDREPNEAEKTRKTEIMQRVAEAYEKSDLLALLRLQLEFNRIDQQHFETLAYDQLRYYNKILKQQADELSEKLYALQSQLSAALGTSVMTATSAIGLELSFNNEVRALKKSVKALKKEVSDLSDPTILKAWLKTYKA